MMLLTIAIILMCLGAASLTFFLIEKTKKYSLKAAMIKATTSLLFISVAIVGLIKNGPHILSIFVLLGLIAGLCGDIFLDFKYVYREKEKFYTFAGFIAFAIGHILYMIGLINEYYVDQNVLYIILPFVIGFLTSLGNISIEKFMKLKYGEYKIISLIYGGLLFSMTMMALSLCIMTNFTNTTLMMFVAGGLLFTISDVILSGTYFGEGKERPIDIISNGITYYIAQFILAFSIFFIL